ncbi:protein-glutamate methylesterase/protein glutamine deamidase [Gammaproteobacteria bacterium]
MVDDSASAREALRKIITADSELELLGAASNPYAAARIIAKEIPDVIVLDVLMPRMDGLTFLRKIMQQRPIPVVMCTVLTEEDSEFVADALKAGAVDVIQKPRARTPESLLEARDKICDAIKVAARTKLRPMASQSVDKDQLDSVKLTADVILPPPNQKRKTPFPTTKRVVCIGASTGGTESLRLLLKDLPADSPGIVIVQHMPERFTKSFADRLNDLCAVTVSEAQDGDVLLPGWVLIAPGNQHTLLRRNGPNYFVEVRDGPLVCRHRPSVDVLFRSAAHYAGPNAVGVLMTGMGDDGARGLLEMRQAGAHTIAEDESSCVVFGMPREAIKLGAADLVLPRGKIGDELLRSYLLWEGS